MSPGLTGVRLSCVAYREPGSQSNCDTVVILPLALLRSNSAARALKVTGAQLAGFIRSESPFAEE